MIFNGRVGQGIANDFEDLLALVGAVLGFFSMRRRVLMRGTGYNQGFQ